jgi:hypothetical protein
VRKDKKGWDILDFELIQPIGDIPDWYKQRIEKWGTKWIGYDLYIGENTIEFYTAWSPPVAIIRKLAELHKDMVFRLEYYELGMAFRGVTTAKWQDGEVLLDDESWNMTDEDFDDLGFSDDLDSNDCLHEEEIESLSSSTFNQSG